MPTSEDLTTFLEGIVDELTDVPNRVYVSPGTPVWDCEQLVVYPSMIVNGTPNNSGLADRGCAPATVAVIVEQVWCIPTGQQPPLKKKMDASGEQVADGAVELYKAVGKTIRAMKCGAAVDDAEMMPPQGGYVAWQVRTRWVL